MARDYQKITMQIGITYFTMFLMFIFNPLLTLILTRKLTLEEYGIYSILTATITVVSIIIELGLSQFISTKFPGLKYDKKVKYFFSLVVFEIIFIILLIGIVTIPSINNYILSLLNILSYHLAFKIILWIIFFEAVFRLMSAFYYAEKKIEFNNFIDFMRRSLWIIILIIYLVFNKDLLVATVFKIWLIGVAITILLSFIPIKKEIIYFIKNHKFNFRIIKNGLKFGIPVLPLLFSTWLIVLADRYILDYFHGLEIVAIYSLAYSLVTLIVSIAQVISTVFYPYIAEAFNKKENFNFLFNAALKYNMLIVFPGTVGLVLLREPIITLISGVKYLAGAPIIVLLFLYPFFASFINLFYYNILLRDKTKSIFIYYLIAAALNISLNFILIPRYSMIGAGIATIVSYVFLFISLYIACRADFEWNFGFLRIFNILAASLILGALLYFLNPITFIQKIIVITIGFMFYIVLLFPLRVFVEQELKMMNTIFSNILNKILHR